MAAERRASSLPPANPFWSDRTQADHELEQMRPVNLESWEAPVPHDDDDLDQSPRVPLPSGVSGHDREHGLQFQTPGDAKPAALTLDSEKPCVEEPEKLETEVTYEPLQHDQATGKRPERVWNRRGQCDEKMSSKAVPSCDENEKKESGLEKGLGDQVLQHFQQETVRLQSQNDSLIKEIQRLKEEKQRSELNVPSSGMQVLGNQHLHLESPHRLENLNMFGCHQTLSDVLQMVHVSLLDLLHHRHHLCPLGQLTCRAMKPVWSRQGSFVG